MENWELKYANLERRTEKQRMALEKTLRKKTTQIGNLQKQVRKLREQRKQNLDTIKELRKLLNEREQNFSAQKQFASMKL
jgi:hypothetical protein